MATGTAGTVARTLSFQAQHYLRFTVNYNDTGIASGIAVSPYLPAGAIIKDTQVVVATAFNGSGTNTLTVGTNSSTYDNMVGTSLDPSATGSTIDIKGGDVGKLAADTQVFYKYNGTTPTTGKAYVVVTYSIDNDS